MVSDLVRQLDPLQPALPTAAAVAVAVAPQTEPAAVAAAPQTEPAAVAAAPQTGLAAATLLRAAAGQRVQEVSLDRRAADLGPPEQDPRSAPTQQQLRLRSERRRDLPSTGSSSSATSHILPVAFCIQCGIAPAPATSSADPEDLVNTASDHVELQC